MGQREIHVKDFLALADDLDYGVGRVHMILVSKTSRFHLLSSTSSRHVGSTWRSCSRRRNPAINQRDVAGDAAKGDGQTGTCSTSWKQWNDTAVLVIQKLDPYLHVSFS